jgi:hypothetical protein
MKIDTESRIARGDCRRDERMMIQSSIRRHRQVIEGLR